MESKGWWKELRQLTIGSLKNKTKQNETTNNKEGVSHYALKVWESIICTLMSKLPAEIKKYKQSLGKKIGEKPEPIQHNTHIVQDTIQND